MARVQGGRWTHEHDGEVVVFVVGMRVNRWRAVRSWSAAFRAMPPVLAELSRERERGYADMPPTGLAAATSPVPVASRGDRAEQRLATGTGS